MAGPFSESTTRAPRPIILRSQIVFVLTNTISHRIWISPGGAPLLGEPEVKMEIFHWFISKLKTIKVKLHLSLKIELRIG